MVPFTVKLVAAASLPVSAATAGPDAAPTANALTTSNATEVARAPRAARGVSLATVPFLPR